MTMRSIVSLGVLLLATAVGSPAQAVPADVLLLLDSSGSMRKALGKATRLAAAKTLATRVINALKAKNRVGLARFAQLEQVVPGGEGKRVVYAEDEKQCTHAANLLAAVTPAGAEQALRWLDGVEAPGNPELAAVGDSPLARAVEVAIDYLRNKRKSDPRRHCVNAYLIVITDGDDTCAAGDALRSRLARLAAQASKEQIHALVLSYSPDAAAARAVATIGQSESAKPFGPDDGDKLLAAVEAIQGHLAPEACIASGVAPAQIGLVPGPAGGDRTPCPTAGGSSGCAVAARRPTDALLLLVLALALALLRLSPFRRVAASFRRVAARGRRRLLFVVPPLALALALALAALAWAGCGDGGGAGSCPPADSGSEAAGPPTGTLIDPAEVQSAVLGRIPTLLASAQDVRDTVLAPLLDTSKVFGALASAEACTTLARSIGFEPYRGAQRGAAGCLATRRCNSFDKALLLQACLQSFGVTAELASCAPDAAFVKQLLAAAARPPVMPDLSAVAAKEKALVQQLFPSQPDAQARLDELVKARDTALAAYFADTVAQDVATLKPLAKLDAGTTDAGAAAALAAALALHYVVRAGGKTIDATLEGSPAETGSCVLGPAVQVDQEAVRLEVQVLVSYAGPVEWYFLGPEVIAAESTILPHAHFGETLTVALADAAANQLAAGIPAASSSGCLRAFIEVGARKVRGDAFYIGANDAATCPGTLLVPLQSGEHIYKVVLRITTQFGELGPSVTVERALVNRYGHALDDLSAGFSGPMYSDETARQLLPLRVDLPLVSGLLSPAALLDAKLRDLSARRAELEAAVATHVGLPPVGSSAPPGPPRPLAEGVIGALVHHAPQLLGSNGLTLVAERPWLLSQVRRRGFGVSGAALGIVEQTIFDVMDAPLLVARGGNASAAARLDAQIAIGALVTEAEAVALAAGKKVRVSNAATMLRDAKLAATWKALDPSALDPQVFPLSVQQAGALHAGEALIVSTGPASAAADGEQQIAWWRLDPTNGRTHGEIRYDGTFYGGAAEVKLLGDIDRCLFGGAVSALSGTACDVGPCLEAAVKSYLRAAAQSYLMGGLFALGGALCMDEALLLGFGELTHEVFDNLNDLIEQSTALPSCS